MDTFSFPKSNFFAPENLTTYLLSMKLVSRLEVFCCTLLSCPHTPILNPRIKPRVPGLELGVDHGNPALTSEYFPLCVSVASCEPRPLRDLVVSLSLTDKITVDGKNTGE